MDCRVVRFLPARHPVEGVTRCQSLLLPFDRPACLLCVGRFCCSPPVRQSVVRLPRVLPAAKSSILAPLFV